MLRKMPTYSICNLLGSDRCMAEISVARLGNFVASHADIKFPHRHSFYQIVLFTQGSGRHSIDFKWYDVTPGQVYYMAPGQIHTWEFDGETDGYLVNFNASFFTSICHNPHFLNEFPLFGSFDNEPVNLLTNSTLADTLFCLEQMVQEFEQGGEYTMDMLRGMLIGVLVRLSRAQPDVYRNGMTKRNLEQLRQFEQLIEQHFHQKRLPKDYAEMMYISPNHLNALTNSVMGKSAGELIRDRVLLEAKRMLTNSDLMIGQIAETLHFEDNAYFTRFFKKYSGATPEGFRAGYLQA